MAQLRTIRLYGKLGARFGRVHRFALDGNSISEAMQALSSQLAGFRAFMMQAKDNGITFAVFVGKRNISEREIAHPSGSDDIRIAPVLIGAKNGGIFQTILGIVLIVADTYLFHTGYLTSLGMGMVAGGVVQMLSPQPRGADKGDSPDNQPSYVFNGAVNTQAQGNPVPYFFGRLRVGSAVVSAGVDAQEYASFASNVLAGTVDGSLKANFYA
ncbi:tail assembly protein [Dyella caseinilytica]|uniref:Tail assembly protein n=1 Tax=Dyella caseinilytica TaxID=1849581 RepID=A0ABX7GPU8_9GAMM|nr:tail assembly protein [Dyella caseinilytica]QRN52386.1 tail assembly protein [Dyella caseinilytica]GGA05500.1 bacteriophage protein [Dyella caseinilytica]